MPLQKLIFKPGVNRDQTNYANEGGWYECNKVRFRSGFPQKIGGWIRSGSYTIIGVCRQMFNYITTASDNILALGTSKKVYLETGTTNLTDITPLRVTYTSASVGHVTDNCFDTTNGSRNVNVNIQGHGAIAGSYVTFSGVVGPIGGIPQAQFNAEFAIVNVVDSNNFTITVTTAATSTATGGGTAIVAAFQINIGNDVTTYGYGWGAGAWGRLAWGSGSVVPVVLPQRDWFFDQFDNNLVMNIRNGPIYYWEYTSAITGRAVLLSSVLGAADVPNEAMQILVAQNNKHLLAFGCQPYAGSPTDFDPLLIRWASQDQPEMWTPLITNTAGFLRVSRGSKIVCAVATRQEILVYTDATLSSLQFLGTTDVFGLQELADNISIISPRCVATVNNMAFWMGKDKFYAYSGRVETLPTTLRNHVFNNLNYDQVDQIVCGTNEAWNEIWWFYPSANSNVNDSYVIYNFLERIWYYGTIERTAWLDSPSREYPIGIGSNFLYEHENGVDADTLPLAAEITSSDFDIIDGDQLMLMKRIIPDIDFAGSTAALPEATLTIKPRNFPGAAYSNIDTADVIESSVGVYTDQVFIRARARQMGFKISSVDLGVQWQLGAPRLDGRPDGKR
jgi:hypothetical protein